MENEYAFTILLRDTKLKPKQTAEALRDFISHFDPNIGIVYVQEVTEGDDSTAFYFDADRYPEMIASDQTKLG